MQAIRHSLHGVLHSADLIEAELRRHLAPLGLSPRQARVLHTMARFGPVSQAELAEAFGITSASMSTMTDRLLASELLTRVPDPKSRRRNVLRLTAQGNDLVDGIDQAWSAVDEMILEVLGDDTDAFLALSRKLRDGLGGVPPRRRLATGALGTAE